MSITDRRIRQSALPIHFVLHSLCYVVKYSDHADPQFSLHKGDAIHRWINELELAFTDTLNLNPRRRIKLRRSTDILMFDIVKEFFTERNVIYMIYTGYHMSQILTKENKWHVTALAEQKFTQVWGEIAQQIEKDHSDIIEGAERSAVKKAHKIVEWLKKRGQYK